MIRASIIATGSYIPENIIGNESFLSTQFYDKNGGKLYQSNKSIVDKFVSITGIRERRYAKPKQNTSDLAYLAAADAISSAGIDKETLDYIIVAHNFGDVSFETNRTSQVPTLASRVKALLQILNPDCVAYDLPFGCPGWVEGLIQASYFIRSGDVKRCLVIGAETLSRIVDPHDRDSMIFSDGAGAAILEGTISGDVGVLAHTTQTHANGYINTLNMGSSSSPYINGKSNLYIKMEGRKVYEFALTHMPKVIDRALKKAGITISEVSKILVHQANEKMDYAILKRLFSLYGLLNIPENIMPMTINHLGNSSVATVPTLLDLMLKGKLEGHEVKHGDIVVFSSVGAGMNVNAIVYRI